VPIIESAMPITRTKTLELADGRILAYRQRPGRGRPLVLLHGLMDCSAGWETLAKATHRPVVAFDLPGMGDSDAPTRPRIGAFAADLAAGIEQLGVRDFTLVGHSFGGAVATALAERIPDEVASLVLLASSGFGRIAATELTSAPVVSQIFRHALPLAIANPITATGIYMAMVTNGRMPDRKLIGRLTSRAWRITPGIQAAAKAMADAGRSDQAFFRREVAYSGPVLALWGSNDLIVSPSHADGVATAFPQAEIMVWDGMGHHPQRERSEDLARFVEHGAAKARRARRQNVHVLRPASRRSKLPLAKPALAKSALAIA
jgi:pyruvate dehydrogenase E2 component (dihydrolipoamide acetyltransferase)